MKMDDGEKLRSIGLKGTRLFSRFDEGIEIDYEGWFSVTPIAQRCKGTRVIWLMLSVALEDTRVHLLRNVTL